MLEQGLTAEDALVGNEVGNAGQALEEAAKTVSATYAYPYQNHATMEPMNATARWNPERCEVWCPTQNGELALQAAAEAANLPPSKCEVYNRLSATKRAAMHQNYILCEKGLIEEFDDALGKTQIGKQRQGSSIRPSVKLSQISPQSPSAQGEHAQLIGWDAWVHIPDQCYVASCTMQRKALERKT